MLACDLIQPITHGIQEILVGGHNGAIEVKLDNRLRSGERLLFRCKFLRRFEQLHFYALGSDRRS
jgi:hypothetical protein